MVTLSGGNQQKAILARWLQTKPTVCILDEPTKGVDIGARAALHRQILARAAQGMAILLISSDLPEVLATSDRIVVMREGRLMRILDRADATQERVLTAAMGRESDVPAGVGDGAAR